MDKKVTRPGRLTPREQLGSGLLFLFAALLIAPLYWRGLPCGHDTMTHLYRIMQLVLNGQDGAPFLQWGQHFMRGYGYPIFPFYAPLLYRLVALFHTIGLDVSQAMRLVGWISLFMAGWGGYQLGRRYLRPSGAFITGLAYLFAPYLIFNGVQRGAFPELLGLALLPWALAAADWAMEQRTKRSIITAVFTFALVTLSHNIIPNFGFIILLGLALSRSKSIRPRALCHAIAPALLIIIATLAVTAFFWLPAYIELDYTQTRRADSPFANWPRFEQHFTDWNALAGWPPEPADPALGNPPTAPKIGAGQAVLAAMGMLLLALQPLHKRPFSHHRPLLMWGLIGIVSLFLATADSWWLWTHLPLPDFVQLPTRFLGPASLSAAILAGVVADGRWWPRFGTPIMLLTAVFVSLSGWFWLYPLYCDAPTATTAATVAQGEQWTETGDVTRWNGASLGETLPRWVDTLPAADALTPFYDADEPLNRLIVPETAVLTAWQPQPNGDSYTLHLPQAQTVTYRAFYFPGWQATVNGAPIPLAPRTGDGLIQLDLPAGDVQLALDFGRTPLRWLTLIFTIVTAIALLGWGWKRAPQAPALSPPSRRTWGWFALAIALLFALKAGIDRTNTPIRADQMANGRLPSIAHPAAINFGGEFMQLGYKGPTEIAADAPFTITQYWTPLRNIGAPYRFRLYITDDAGRIWNMPFTRPADYADLPGKQGWQPDHYVRDAYRFQLLPGTPPGSYWLETAVFRADTDLSLIPQNAQTGNNPAHARIGQLTIRAGDWNADKLSADKAQVATFAPTALDGLTLLGWTVPTITYRSGETAQIGLLWQQTATIAPENSTLWLRDSDGNNVTHHPFAIGGDAGWPTNAIMRDQVQWRLPAELESGTYTVWLGANEPIAELGSLQIDAPPHNFTPPEPVEGKNQLVFATTFAELVSHNAEMMDGTVSLTLLWHALATADDSYRVFVHLRDADGNNIAQSDAIPDRWTRPTTGWVNGEYIHDAHTLTAPAGTYSIAVGWYNPATGARLADAIIGELTIE